VMKWIFDADPSNEQVLELLFSESNGATTVQLVNTGISTHERRESQDHGWRGCLAELARALADPSATSIN